jgi:hypothetical protein
MSNGIFLFYLANYLQTLSLENLSAAKFMPVTYMCIVFIFILGAILLHETVYFTDIVGAGLIIGFQAYNYYNPPGRQINQNDIVVQDNTKNDIESNVEKKESSIQIEEKNDDIKGSQ